MEKDRENRFRFVQTSISKKANPYHSNPYHLSFIILSFIISEVSDAGGKFIVSPNFNPEVIRQTKQLGLRSFPGIATPTEAFSALEFGADALKIFPAELIPPVGIKAMLAVLPKGTSLLPVGGINHANMEAYIKAGAVGFGFGGSLFKPEFSLSQIEENAHSIVKAYQKLRT